MATRSSHAAYVAAYDTSRMKTSTAMSEGSRTLALPNISAKISERLLAIGEDASARDVLDARTALDLFMTIAEADPNELIGLRVGCCRHCHGGPDFLYQWREHEFLTACQKAEQASKPMPDIGAGLDYNHTLPPVSGCPECRGEGISRIVPQDTRKLSPAAKLLWQGVKQTKDGLVMMLADKTKALESAAKIVGAFTERIHVTGTVATIAPDTAGKSDEEVAKLYASFVKG